MSRQKLLEAVLALNNNGPSDLGSAIVGSAIPSESAPEDWPPDYILVY